MMTAFCIMIAGGVTARAKIGSSRKLCFFDLY